MAISAAAYVSLGSVNVPAPWPWLLASPLIVWNCLLLYLVLRSAWVPGLADDPVRSVS